MHRKTFRIETRNINIGSPSSKL